MSAVTTKKSGLGAIVVFLSVLIIASLIAGASRPLSAQKPETVTGPGKNKNGEKKTENRIGDVLNPEPVVTRHKVVAAGKEIRYTATAGQLPITNDAGETEAQMFFISYTVDNPVPPVQRPLLFMFNGGPGAASVWLHMGAAGPRRVKMLADGSMPPPPFRIIDNDSTWLDTADLVFIDPVGTGFSRAAKPELTKKFTSVQGDIDSVGRFIRLYLTRYERWGSPLFLVGESYGTFRAAGLSEYLLEHGIALNGMALISFILNLQTTSFDSGNDLPYALFMPSYAATAWYHKKISQHTDLDKTLEAAEAWASNDYLKALTEGDRLPPAEREAVIDKLSRFTGLDKSFIKGRNLRIDRKSFAEELLRGEGRLVGFMDSRLTAANLNPAGHYDFDPTVAAIRPPFTAAFNDYVRKEIGFKSDMEYFTLGGGIGHWDWDAKNSYAESSDSLRSAFAKNPYMKIFVASGYFDLATPYFATEYTLAHMGLTPALRKNISTHRYHTGHMMYLDSVAISLLKSDMAEFIKNALMDN